jgi:hypothetical protein
MFFIFFIKNIKSKTVDVKKPLQIKPKIFDVKKESLKLGLKLFMKSNLENNIFYNI